MPRPRGLSTHLGAAALLASLPSAAAPVVRYEQGPCPHCGRHILADHARDSIAHAEPVCLPFERAMMAACGHGGRPDILSPELGCLVPDLRAMREEGEQARRRRRS